MKLTDILLVYLTLSSLKNTFYCGEKLKMEKTVFRYTLLYIKYCKNFLNQK